jgi:hypothetical protein
LVLPLFFLAALAAPPSAPVDLGRVYEKNEKLAYQVRSHVTAESRMNGLDTFIPQDLDINYNFIEQVTAMRPDGIAVMHYERPSMTEITGETVNAGPVAKTTKVDLDYLLSVSPVNQILEEKDVSKSPNRPSEIGGKAIQLRNRQDARSFFAPFISDIHRLALFIGGVEDSLDFAPKLPLHSVKVGDIWKATVGFQPQKLKGSDAKSAVQRLDYAYTYLGPIEKDGKKYLRVEGKLDFSTDLAEFFKQLLGSQATETNVAKVPLHFTATIDFDLDPSTHDTIRAVGVTEGGYQIYLTNDPDNAMEEERFKGKTTMELTGKKFVAGKTST